MNTTGGIVLPGGENLGRNDFWLVGEDSPQSPSRKNPVYIYIYIYIYIYLYIYIFIYIYNTYASRFLYTMKKLRVHHVYRAKVAILLLQDLSTLCVTDIYGIYFRFSVHCL